MENMDFLHPTAPRLVFARETYTPYCLSLQFYNASVTMLPQRLSPIQCRRRHCMQFIYFHKAPVLVHIGLADVKYVHDLQR